MIAGFEDAREIAESVGYPVILKAVAGGGGKGMRVCKDEVELERNFHIASTEAAKAFSNPDLYLEKVIVNPHHVEIQLLATSTATTSISASVTAPSSAATRN